MMTRSRRNASRKTETPKPEFALCVVVKHRLLCGLNYPVGYIMPFQVNHKHTQSLIAEGLIRAFDPAKDDRGPSRPYRNLWTREDGEWFPETEGSWAIRYRDDADPEIRRRHQFQYGEIGHPRYSIEEAREDLAKVVRQTPSLAAHLCVAKMPCVFSNRESHIICD